MKRSADQAQLDAPAAAAAAAAAPPPAADAAAADAPAPHPAVASAVAQLESLWEGLPVRHRSKFRDHAYMLFVGHEAAESFGDSLDPHEQEEATEERQAALAAVGNIAAELRDQVPNLAYAHHPLPLPPSSHPLQIWRQTVASAGSGDAPSEACRFPASASLKGCTEENSVFVDDFLYDDDALEALYDADPPKLSRSYCEFT